MVGKEASVLVETGNIGRCENFATGVLPKGNQFNKGNIVKLKALGVEGERLIFTNF
jgi:hypothetical protein